MSEDLCPYCGTALLRTNADKVYCPNHGIIDKPEASGEEFEGKRKGRGYIG